jgi:spore germination protein YaaH
MRELLPVMLLAAACLSSLGAAPQPDAGRPERTVYAWFPRNFGNWDTSAIDWSAITHLCFRSVVLQPDGALREPVPREKVRGLVEEAHAHGVKVTVLVWGTDAAGSSRYLARHRDRAVESLVGYVRDNGLDGLNMDDETWAETNAETNGPNRELVTAFFGALRGGLDDLRPGLHLTWASPPVIDAGDRYGEAWPDYRAIADTIDGFCIMSYCMAPPRTGWTTGAQPVSGGPIVTGHRRDYTTCIADYVAATGGRADKLLLGIANDRGGTEWTCRGPDALSPIVGDPRPLSPEEARARAVEYGRRFHSEQQEPWYRHPDGDLWVQGWYEDDESLKAKLDLAAARGVGGVCVWVLDGAAEPPSTFDLLKAYRTAP